jgi:sensor histidine kinase YesM
MTSPNLFERLIPYLIWFLIVILTNYFFTVYSKKTKSTQKLLPAVFFTVWFIITTLSLVLNLINPSLGHQINPSLEISYILAGELAFNLPQVVIFGGIAYALKHRKLSKGN